VLHDTVGEGINLSRPAPFQSASVRSHRCAARRRPRLSSRAPVPTTTVRAATPCLLTSRVLAPRHCRGPKPHAAAVRTPRCRRPAALASAGKGFHAVLVTAPPAAALAPSGTAHFFSIYPCAGHRRLHPRARQRRLFFRAGEASAMSPSLAPFTVPSSCRRSCAVMCARTGAERAAGPQGLAGQSQAGPGCGPRTCCASRPRRC
jgi:hypothetical protein